MSERSASCAAATARVIVVFALAGCGKGADSEPPPPAPATVAVHARAAEQREFRDVVTATGRWKSSGDVVVTAPFAAICDSLGVQLGDHVAAGQELCLLVTNEARAALRGAEALRAHATDEASRADAARAVELARGELVQVPVKAPRAGTVTRLSAAVGGEIAASSEILALVPDDALVFEAHVAPAQGKLVRVGEVAAIEEAGRAPRAASVRRILPVTDSSDQALLVWLSPNAPAPFPGLDRFGTASIETGAPRPALAVPDAAIVEDDVTGETRVVRVAGTPPRGVWTAVTFGASADHWREVLGSSLASGTLVVTEGQRGFPDSTLVNVLP